MGLQPGAHGVTAWGTWGCRLVHIGLQPGSLRVAAWGTWGLQARACSRMTRSEWSTNEMQLT
eukprot:scaffold60631_cov27-Phaeocystis_antarctica.AAC.1